MREIHARFGVFAPVNMFDFVFIWRQMRVWSVLVYGGGQGVARAMLITAVLWHDDDDDDDDDDAAASAAASARVRES
jgi:hypothetical protein